MDLPEVATDLVKSAAAIAERAEVALVTINAEEDVEGADMIEASRCANRECPNVHVVVYDEENHDGSYGSRRAFNLDTQTREWVESHDYTPAAQQRALAEAFVAELRDDGHDITVADVLDSLACAGLGLSGDGSAASAAYTELIGEGDG